MNLQNIKNKIKNFFKFLFNVATSKKTLALLIGCLLFYRMRTFPQQMMTSDFLKCFNSDKNIFASLINLNNHILLFKTISGHNFICNYSPLNIDSFNQSLISKNVDFEHLSGLQAVLHNPYNQLFAIAAILGSLLGNINIHNLFKRSRSKKVETKENVFQDFIANDQVKNSISLVIDQLKHPEKYEDKKIKLFKGCLVYGKPGTGKTLLARCLSKIEGITFINTCASEFVEIYVGSGARKVREIFRIARENKPAIIFIDELESIGVHRSTDTNVYTNNIERYSTLNQLLAEMDGIVDNDNIVVIAATNREDLLDSALVRPGRFSVKINLSLPEKEQRENIFKLYLNKYKYDKSTINNNDIEQYAIKSEFLTGANIESIVNDAASSALSKNRDINKEDMDEAFNRNIEEFMRFKKYEMKNSQY